MLNMNQWKRINTPPVVNYCQVCGNTELHMTIWIEMHGGDDTGSDSPTDQVWCAECDTDTESTTTPFPLPTTLMAECSDTECDVEDCEGFHPLVIHGAYANRDWHLANALR